MYRLLALFLPRNWGRLSRAVLGDLNYDPPPWLRRSSVGLYDHMRRHPGVWVGLILLGGVIAAGNWYGQQWWERHKPRPKALVESREISGKVTIPGITPIVKDKLVPQNLVLEFSGSVAPVEAVGKPAINAIKLSPSVDGEWTWADDKNLVFKPAKDWPAGTAYELTTTFALPPSTKLKQTTWKFATAEFDPKVVKSEFYTDPKDPEIHQIVVEYSFTHPVAKEEVQKRLSLDVLGKTPVFDFKGKKPDSYFTLTEGAHQRQYWLRSTRITVPEKEDFVNVTLAKGLQSTIGGQTTLAPVTAKVRVPDEYSGFSVAGASTDIVRTDEGDPEQFIFVNTDGYVTTEELAKHTSAWILPKDKPATKAGKAEEDYGWPNAGEVTPEILAASKPLPLKAQEAEAEGDTPMATTHAFKIPATPKGRVFLRVAKGVKALGGFKLGRDLSFLEDVPNLPKEVEILGSGALLALSGEKKLNLKYRGVQHLRITMARVPFSQINHLARLTEGDFASPYWKIDFDENNISRVHREVRPVAMANEYQAGFSALDFAQALAAPDASDPDASRGLYFLTVEGVRPMTEDELLSREDPDDKEETESKWVSLGESVTAKRFILVTDLGLLMKRNADNTREFFVQSLSRGEPAAGVKIIVLAKNGEFLHEGVTDSQGHISLPNVSHLRREKLPVAVLARQGNDVAFLPFDRADRLLDFSRFDTEGVLASEKETLDGHLFTERGVYRPGDAVHIAGVVKRRDWEGVAEGLPLVLEVLDSHDQIVDTQTITLPEGGFFDAEVTTAEDSSTGTYTARLFLLPDASDEATRVLINRTAFRVEDFQPDRMKLEIAMNVAPAAGWVQPKDVKATVSLQTLFGMAAEKRRVTGKLSLSPGDFAFEQYPDFTFHNRLKEEKSDDEEEESAEAGQEIELGEQITNAKGETEFDLALERFSDGLFRAEFFAEGFEADGGRGVRGAKSILIAPLPYVVGWKADGDIRYIGMDGQRSLQLLALTPDLKSTALPDLRQRIIQIRHVSVLAKQESGSFAYVSTVREQTYKEGIFSVAAGGSPFVLPTDKPGEYRFELLDSENNIVCATPFTVVGKGDAERSLERDAELEMKLASTQLATGSTLGFSLRAPFTGAGLATIEREKVLGWQWIKQATPDATHSIPVPQGMEGTGYLNVSFVRSLDSPEIFTSPLSYAVQPFGVDVDKRRMAVTLDVPKLVKPGDTLTIGYQSAKPSRIVVYAVDEGIQQVTNYKLPDPLKHFMRKRGLEVESEQILDLILPEFSLLTKQKAFGGSEDVPLKMHLNPFKRRKEAPVVYWSGIIEAGPDRQEVTYDVPDYFAGSLKIMAVAIADDSVGTAEAQSTVRGPFVLTPNAPFFAAPGDEFTASVTVANNMEGPTAPAAVFLKATANEFLEFLSPAEVQVPAAPGKEATARFQLRVKSSLGGAELVFLAEGGGESVQRSATLSVRPAAPYRTQVQSGYFRLGKQDIPVDRDIYPEFRKSDAAVSTLPIGLARGLEAYLREYPHGCSEQITSRAMSRLLLADEADFGFDKAEAVEQLDRAFELLRYRQHGNGGFGYWDSECNNALDFLSVYVALFLTEAKDAGYAVPADVLDGARRRLKAMARVTPSSVEDAGIEAAAIYLLTRHGEVTTNLILNLRDTLEKNYAGKWENTLAGAYLASTYVLLKQDKEGRALMDTYLRGAEKKPFLGTWAGTWWSDPKVRQAEAFALVCRHFPDTALKLGYDDIAVITEPISQRRFNTVSSALSIMALKAYSALAKKSDVSLSISELAKDAGNTLKLLIPPSPGFLHVPFGEQASTVRFELEKGSGDLGAFYQVSESGFDKGIPKQPVNDGLEVYRELIGADGKPVSQLKTGESVTVRLNIRNISPADQSNVALLDLMPGSFEVEQGALTPGRNTIAGADFVEMREDRNVFFLNIRKGEMQSFTYRVNPIAAGTFVIPPVYAEAMYDQAIQGRGLAGSIVVTPAQ